MQHTETRWLTMKYVAVRVLQQWKNFNEYFLKFLPRKSNFKSIVANTDRYQRICAALQDPLTEAYTVKPRFNGQMRTNDSPLLEKVR